MGHPGRIKVSQADFSGRGLLHSGDSRPLFISSQNPAYHMGLFNHARQAMVESLELER